MGIMLSPKLRQARPGVYQHWCPGCKSRHQFEVGEANASGHRWSFDGNVQAPTFAPSMHIQIGPWDDERGHHPKRTICHYTITAGRIEFHKDTPHALSGQTVDLPDMPPAHSL